MMYGNKIVDGGNYLFTAEEKIEFVKLEPNSQKYFKKILSGDEYLNGSDRWILYLNNILPSELNASKYIKDRVNKVKNYRAESTKLQTRNAANTPTIFTEPRQPDSTFLLIPRTSSENRKYIPLGFFTPDYIVNDSCTALPNATLYHFGMLTSLMHMAWVKFTCGRLKSDYRYSNSIVYNNYPWPENPSEKQIKAVEAAAQGVLDSRLAFPNSSLADLYNPLTMPPALVKAHQALDKAVDQCYRAQPFASDTKRVEFLFDLYDKYTAGLFAAAAKPKKEKKAATQSV
jgi:hypothetical protein